jgi:helicase
MEQIVALKKLERSLERIRLCENYITLQDLITELHFAYEVSRLGRDAPEPSDLRTLWDAAYYLLTALNNPRRAASLGEEQVSEGLAIAGLVFELLGKLAEVGNDTNAREECYINAAVCDSLSDYEANSAVLAEKYFDLEKTAGSFTPSLIGMEEFGRNLVCATLAREFLWIYRQREAIRGLVTACSGDDFRVNWSQQLLGELDSWCKLCLALMELSLFMTNGAAEAQERSFQSLLQAKSLALDWSLPSHHWLASILLKCAQKMCRDSVWEVLRSEGFDDRYIQILASTPWDPVYELWRSQIVALRKVPVEGLAEPINVLSDAVKRVVVSMPTSAGKTVLAELAIVKELQKGDGRKCVYVAPSRALVSEVETKLHRRLRFLNYRVASVVGSFELGFVEEDYLQDVDVAILTQEKLDYLVRKQDPFMDKVSLIVFDEVHKIGEGHRGWLLETLIAWLLLKQRFSDVKMMFMSAVLPKSSRADIRLWVGNRASAPAAVEEWKPTRQLEGICWFGPKPIWKNPWNVDKRGY